MKMLIPKSRMARLFSCARATSAIEFALISPLLVLFLCGTIQFSLIFYTYNSAQQAGWLVARQVATGVITASNAAGAARTMLPNWAQTAAVIPPVTLNNGVYTLTITISLANASPVNFMSNLLGSASLTTTATFLSEVG